MDNPGELWDSLVASAQAKQAHSQNGKPYGAVKLKLRPDPARVHRAEAPRSLVEIDKGLRQVIRGLVSGDLAWPLFLRSDAGRGKTCAALCLLDYTAGPTEYFTTADLVSMVQLVNQGRFMAKADQGPVVLQPDQFWRRMKRAELVVLDEIGSRDRVSDSHYEIVQRLLDCRDGKPAVYVSNLKGSALALNYDDRIVSRLSRGIVFELEGKDRRLES